MVKVAASLMLYNTDIFLLLAQVFAQTGLMSFIEHGESLLLNQDAGRQMSPGTRGSPKAAVSSIKAVLVNCDGPMFQYTPIFDQNILQLVSTIVDVVGVYVYDESEKERERERERKVKLIYLLLIDRYNHCGRRYSMQSWFLHHS